MECPKYSYLFGRWDSPRSDVLAEISGGPSAWPSSDFARLAAGGALDKVLQRLYLDGAFHTLAAWMQSIVRPY